MLAEKAKEIVVMAGKKLVESGLIARTWGNVSCRIDEKQFAVTPSGRDYNTLKIDDIVIVNIEDLSYEGNIKPSSEKGMHADIYKHRKDINFVIHTHQLNASAISAVGENLLIIDEENKKLIGEKVICADYGLPGTKKLRAGVVKALEKNQSNAVILSNHGAVCMGKDYDETFSVAFELENECEDYIQSYISSAKKSSDNNYLTDDEKNIIVESIIKKRKDINNVMFSNDENIVLASKYCSTIKPLLDDFAQICGTSLITVDFNKNNMEVSINLILKSLKRGNVVLINSYGAICCGNNESDASAVQIVTKKQCKAYILAREKNNLKYINPVECLLMRFVYLKKYSKKINQ